MRTVLERLAAGKSFSEQEMEQAMNIVLSGDVSDSELGGFLIGLKTKGETVEEIVGLVKALRKKALPFRVYVPNVMDNCGTGGDGLKTFNISTTSAFVIAGAGIPVAKHGSRSVSSKSGSADVLEELGINLNLPPRASEELLHKLGITFLFAPHVHPKTKRIVKVRRDLRVPTIFNLIGPLTNPVDLDSQLLGIYRRDMLNMFAEVLKMLGRKRAVVLNGAGYMDEASLAGENHLAILENGVIYNKILHPEEVGLPVYGNEAIVGGDAKENAGILLDVLKGKKGPHRDIVLLNAGLGIFANGKAATIQEGIELAKESIDSGAAMEKLEGLRKMSQSYHAEVM